MALNAEPSTSRWLPSHVYATADEAQSRLKYLISCYKDPGHPQLGPYVLAVVEASTSRLLGHVGFSPIGNEVEVSYAIAESARGRGYGAESLIHACKWAAASFGVSRIVALTASANVASRRTLERASFGHDRDAEQGFQGVRQVVSRYCWHAAGGGA
jgi:RimJ/RimL family protein N-acetyltransferase